MLVNPAYGDDVTGGKAVGTVPGPEDTKVNRTQSLGVHFPSETSKAIRENVTGLGQRVILTTETVSGGRDSLCPLKGESLVVRGYKGLVVSDWGPLGALWGGCTAGINTGL